MFNPTYWTHSDALATVRIHVSNCIGIPVCMHINVPRDVRSVFSMCHSYLSSFAVGVLTSSSARATPLPRVACSAHKLRCSCWKLFDSLNDRPHLVPHVDSVSENRSHFIHNLLVKREYIKHMYKTLGSCSLNLPLANCSRLEVRLATADGEFSKLRSPRRCFHRGSVSSTKPASVSLFLVIQRLF